MKKKIIIISIIILFTISAVIIGFYSYSNYRDMQISLINETIIIEYGEKYTPDKKTLIDLKKYNFIDIDKLTIQNEIVNEEGKDYPKVGEYKIYVIYKNKKLEQNVKIVDTTKPIITVNDPIKIPYDTDIEKFDFKKYITVDDLSKTNDFDIDLSNINTQNPGEYNLKIKVSDVYNNLSEKEFKIIIEEKVEEEKIEEKQETEEPKTSNKKTQTKTENKTNTYKSNSQNNNSKTNTSSNTETEKKNTTTSSNSNNTTKKEEAYWCVEGGSHHLAGDGANEHGYYKTWDSAYEAFEEYTKGWPSCQFKVDQCPCGLYYFWAIQ